MYVYVDNERYGAMLINIQSPYYTIQKITQDTDMDLLPVDIDSYKVRRAGSIIMINKEVILVQLYTELDIATLIDKAMKDEIEYTIFYLGENKGTITISHQWNDGMIYDRQNNCFLMRGKDITDELTTLRFRKQEINKADGKQCYIDLTHNYNPLELTRSSLTDNYCYQEIGHNVLTHLYVASNVLTGRKIFYSSCKDGQALFEQDTNGLYRVIEYERDAYTISKNLKQLVLPGYIGKVKQILKEIHERYIIEEYTDVLWSVFINKKLQEVNIDYAKRFKLAVCFVEYEGNKYTIKGINWCDCLKNEYIVLAEIDIMQVLEDR